MLISAWLNTSKDPLVGNEQCSGAFWKRIATFYAASPNIAPGEEREANQCKHHWHKINDQVSRFSRSYAAATREKTSAKMRLMLSNMLTRYSTTTTKRSLPLNTRGGSFAMTRNGVAMKAATKGGSLVMVLIQQANL